MRVLANPKRLARNYGGSQVNYMSLLRSPGGYGKVWINFQTQKNCSCLEQFFVFQLFHNYVKLKRRFNVYLVMKHLYRITCVCV